MELQDGVGEPWYSGSMDIETWLKRSVATLDTAGIGTARLDALVLLEDCLHTDRARLLAHPGTALTSEQVSTLDGYIERRVTHEPLAYIRGKTEFYGRDFTVNKNVLEPRPESETIIDLLKTLPPSEHMGGHPTIVDVGTGSGALAITAKLELPGATVIGIDIDPACLEVARRNSNQLKADVSYLQGDLAQPLANLEAKQLVLLCNLPYVPDDFQINLAAGHEPRLAIFGGSDGLDFYRKLFEQLDSLDLRPGYILAESLPTQHAHLRELAAVHGYGLSAEEDFVQLFVPQT